MSFFDNIIKNSASIKDKITSSSLSEHISSNKSWGGALSEGSSLDIEGIGKSFGFSKESLPSFSDSSSFQSSITNSLGGNIKTNPGISSGLENIFSQKDIISDNLKLSEGEQLSSFIPEDQKGSFIDIFDKFDSDISESVLSSKVSSESFKKNIVVSEPQKENTSCVCQGGDPFASGENECLSSGGSWVCREVSAAEVESMQKFTTSILGGPFANMNEIPESSSSTNEMQETISSFLDKSSGNLFKDGIKIPTINTIAGNKSSTPIGSVPKSIDNLRPLDSQEILLSLPKVHQESIKSWDVEFSEQSVNHSISELDDIVNVDQWTNPADCRKYKKQEALVSTNQSCVCQGGDPFASGKDECLNSNGKWVCREISDAEVAQWKSWAPDVSKFEGAAKSSLVEAEEQVHTLFGKIVKDNDSSSSINIKNADADEAYQTQWIQEGFDNTCLRTPTQVTDIKPKKEEKPVPLNTSEKTFCDFTRASEKVKNVILEKYGKLIIGEYPKGKATCEKYAGKWSSWTVKVYEDDAILPKGDCFVNKDGVIRTYLDIEQAECYNMNGFDWVKKSDVVI